MADLAKGEFELDGYGFGGRDHDIVVPPSGFDPGSHGVRDQDTNNSVGDNVRFGTDRKSPPVWSFDLLTNQYSAIAASDALDRMARAWDAPDVRLTPGALSVLRYNHDGRQRRVYGRSRRFAEALHKTREQGVTAAVADFQLAEDRYYDDELQTTSVSIVPASTGGLVGPLVGKLTTAAGGSRQGTITVGGTAPTPVEVEIHGPITRPYVAGPGWRIELNTTLAYDQSVVINTRAGSTYVRRNDGASLAGTLTRTSRLSTAQLQPGPATLTFGGSDATGTAWCRVSWRPAHYSL